MRKTLLASVYGFCLFVCCSCGPNGGPKVVTIRSLVESFRVVPAHSQKTYIGQTLAVPIKLDRTRIEGNKVLFTAIDGASPCVEFWFAEPISPSLKQAVTITGICHNCVYDNIDRGLAINFRIVFTDCRME